MTKLMKVILMFLSTKLAAVRIQQTQQTSTAVPGPSKSAKAVMDNLPGIVETLPTVEGFWRGHDSLTHALRSAFYTPLNNVSSLKELESTLTAALVQSGAVRDARELAKKVKLSDVEINSMNFGLARSFAPYPWFVEDTVIDYFPLHVSGGVTFFLNVALTEAETGNGNETAKKGDVRLCVAVGGGGSLYFSGDSWKGFKGTEFGGEDFYLGFAKVKNVPGTSWFMNFNRDYLDSGIKRGRLAYAWETAQYYESIRKPWHLKTIFSRLTGGFEFTIPGNEFVAINFEYCIFGKSQGGKCMASFGKAEAEAMAKEHGMDWRGDASEGKKPFEVQKEEWITDEIHRRQFKKGDDKYPEFLDKKEIDEIYADADTVFERERKYRKNLNNVNKLIGNTIEGGGANTWCGSFGL